MSIVWVQGSGGSVQEAVDAVQQALADGSGADVTSASSGDSYLAAQVETLHGAWSIDPWAVVAGQGRLGRAFQLGQRVVRRLSWWYTQPQIAQANHFHAALVRVMDVLLDAAAQHGRRIGQLEAAHSEMRLRAHEEEIRHLRAEQARLRQQIDALAARLAQRPALDGTHLAEDQA